MQALEKLGETCLDSGFNFSAATHLASTITALDQFGSQTLKLQYLPRLTAGRLVGAHAISEPEAGSDALSMTTTARLDGGHYVLNGYKAFVTNGPIADVIVVYAKTSDTAAADCLSAFLVETNNSGVSLGPEIEKVGLANSPISGLQLSSCRVPVDHMVGAKGAGFFVLSQVMQREILYSFIIHVGEMKRRLDECVFYARNRKQFGQHIGSFQSVSSKIADMKIRYELGRHWLYHVADRLGRNKDVTSDIAIAKVFVSESSLTSAIDALHLHGGKGYMAESGFGVGVCDSLAAAIYSGTNDIQRGRIAALLGVAPKPKKPVHAEGLRAVWRASESTPAELSNFESSRRTSAIFDYCDPAVQVYVRPSNDPRPRSERDRAVDLYHAVRDGINYEVFGTDISESGIAASSIVRSAKGFCLHKAILYVAACRAAGLAAQLAVCKVTNHMSADELRSLVGGDTFLHWFAQVKIDDAWLKVSPTFNKRLCQLYGMKPLEFDGTSDAIEQHYGGNATMHYEGGMRVLVDPTYAQILELIRLHHPLMVTAERVVPRKSARPSLGRP